MSDELVILTRGQEDLYKYLLFSDHPVPGRMAILDRMVDVFPSDRVFLDMIRRAAEETGGIVSYEYLVEKDFPYHLDHVKGESTLSPAEAHLTVAAEAELQRKKRDSSDLLSLSRHLLECSDPSECAKGKCPSLSKRSPLDVLEKISMRMSGGTEETKPLRFRDIYDERKNRSLGAQTFIQPFDEKVQGLEPGNLCVVAGWTGSFKTTFALNLAHQNAILNGYNTVFITSEVPKKLLYLWLLCRHSFEAKFAHHGPVHRLGTQKATLTEEEETFIEKEVEPDLLENPNYGKVLILDETDFRSFTRSGLKAKLLSLPFEVDILVYDYIQLVKYLEEARDFRWSNTDPINHYVRIFADLAMHLYGDRHQVLSLLLSQINREGWKKAKDNDGEYDLTALAEANELEKSAYYIVTLYSDEDLKDSGEVKAQLLKHRGGETHESSVIVPIDSRFLAVGHGIEGFGDGSCRQDMSSLLSSGEDLFGEDT